MEVGRRTGKDLPIMLSITVSDLAGRTLSGQTLDAVLASVSSYPIFSIGLNCSFGANQENAAYPSGLCAERTTLFAANAQYPDQPVLALAIAARKGNRFMPTPISPCGACRQVISGVEDRFGHPVRILLYGTEGIYECNGIDALLPLRFVDSDMHI